MSRARAAAGWGVAAALWAPGPHAGTLRCDGGIVSRGDTVETVLARCGEPAHRSGHQRELKAPPEYGPGAVRRVDVEIWTYRRGYGRFIQHLTFEGGRLARIDRGPRED